GSSPNRATPTPSWTPTTSSDPRYPKSSNPLVSAKRRSNGDRHSRGWVGTSGWAYDEWRGMFYPTGLARRRELQYLSRKLSSVEINGSFYSLQRPSSYRKWFDQTPDDFLFAVKGSRYITHLKRLREVTEPMATFFASGLL